LSPALPRFRRDQGHTIRGQDGAGEDDGADVGRLSAPISASSLDWPSPAFRTSTFATTSSSGSTRWRARNGDVSNTPGHHSVPFTQARYIHPRPDTEQRNLSAWSMEHGSRPGHVARSVLTVASTGRALFYGRICPLRFRAPPVPHRTGNAGQQRCRTVTSGVSEMAFDVRFLRK
jgi:hypothetical protein